VNTTFLRNLTDHEFLKQARPATELERMLIDRLEGADGDEGEIAALEQQAHDAEERCSEAKEDVEELENEIEGLRAYAKQLHEALSAAEPDNELLDNEDAEMLRP